MKTTSIIIMLLLTVNVYAGRNIFHDANKKQHNINNRNSKHQKRAKISIISHPSNAKVIINGKKHRYKTDTIVKLTLNKHYNIVVQKRGFQPEIKKFVFYGNQQALHFKLKPRIKAHIFRTLTKHQIQKVLHQIYPKLRGCVPRRDTGRTIGVRFIIQQNGRISNVQIANNAGQSKECILKRLKQIRFPLFSGPAIPITYPFKF